jgi:hypothetical protein
MTNETRTSRQLTDRYVSLWNEPDPAVRGAIVKELWAPGGEHVLQPPQNLREQAQAVGFDAPTLEIRGHAAITARAGRAFERFVAPGQHRFRSRDNAIRLRNVVKFNWEMVSTTTGEVAAVGLEMLVLDENEQIAIDYQFIEA